MEKLHINDIKQTLGTKGEAFVRQLLVSRGYNTYKSNLRKWGFEVDLLVYKLIPERKTLEIRAVEVKTRSKARLATLEDLKIDQKLLKYRYFMFNIGQELKLSLSESGHVDQVERWYFKYHLDLAIVGREAGQQCEEKTLYLQKYIQNVNLLI